MTQWGVLGGGSAKTDQVNPLATASFGFVVAVSDRTLYIRKEQYLFRISRWQIDSIKVCYKVGSNTNLIGCCPVMMQGCRVLVGSCLDMIIVMGGESLSLI